MKSTFVGLAVTFAALAAASPQYGYGGRPAPTHDVWWMLPSMPRTSNTNVHPAAMSDDDDNKDDDDKDEEAVSDHLCRRTTAGPKKCGGLQGLQCGKGEICIDDPKSPCGIAVDCLGICVVEEFCGGFAGSACEDPNDVCIDDPRDECDPENGGADCGGLCIPKSWAK
ncbi:hypothetical protein Dda_5305 [Drechslerella dactyloides]|uniref:Uncharacterized protein n=1 Tax=Drechslerella dactyloides TaxID=74499 RepID=A0AAD6IWI3_DREDA|nr:hypothetical protein Dda_5305 [Drechslerella dactyloides]